MNRVLWGYDESTQQITTLPASPWLLPAMGVLAFVMLVEKIILTSEKAPRELPEGFNKKEWDRNQRRYLELLEIEKSRELTIAEHYELKCKLPYPSWAKPGEFWTY